MGLGTCPALHALIASTVTLVAKPKNPVTSAATTMRGTQTERCLVVSFTLP
jgi:hypothetical protein